MGSRLLIKSKKRVFYYSFYQSLF